MSKKQKQYQIGCVVGYGASTTAARADAESKAALALRVVKPILIRYEDELELAVLAPDGWTVYSGGALRVVASYPSSHSREMVERGMLYNVAQRTWEHGDSSEHPLLVQDKEALADFRSWVGFQRRFRYYEAKLVPLRAPGGKVRSPEMISTLAHSLAGGMIRPEDFAILKYEETTEAVLLSIDPTGAPGDPNGMRLLLKEGYVS